MELLKAQIVDPLLQAGKPSFMSWLQLLVDNLLDDNDSNGLAFPVFGGYVC